MSYRLGIDLGATMIVAVVADDTGAVRAIPLGREAAVPSAVLVDTNGAIRCGEEASAAGVAMPDRMARRYVPRIGDEVPITVGSATGRHAQLHPQDITAAVVAWAMAKATANERAVPDAIALVHPAAWGAHKLELMQRALAARGLGHVNLVSSAVAAGYAWIRINNAAAGEAFAVFDLGGESVSASVLRVGSDGQAWPLGVPAARADLGGVDFDDAVLRHVLDALDPAIREALLEAGPGASALDALRLACRTAKETLSSATDATVEVTVHDRKVLTRITRSEFESAVSEAVRRSIDVLFDAVAGAGLRIGDLSGVLLCGGSSAVPLIAAQLTTRLGPTVRMIREIHPAFTAAAGASLLIGPPPAVVPVPEPEPATAPERPILDVPTVVGRKPAAPIAAAVAEDDGPGRWGSIRIVPMRKSAEPSPKEISRAQAAAARLQEAAAREQEAAARQQEAVTDQRAAVAQAESKQRAEAQRMAQAQAEQAKAAAARAEAARRQASAEATAARREALEQARLAAQRAEAERAAAERAEAEHNRLSAEIARLTEENARLAARSAAAEQAAVALASAQREAIRKAAALKLARRAAAERARATAEAAAAEQVAADRAAAEQVAADRAAEDRAAAEQAAAEQAALEAAAAQHEAAERDRVRSEEAAEIHLGAATASRAPGRLPEPGVRPGRPSRRRHQVPVVDAGPLSVRSVVAPRDLGSLEDLLGTPAPRRLSAPADVEAQLASESTLEIVTGTEVEELYELTEGEFWIDEHGQIVDVLGNVYEYADENAEPRDLWHRSLAICKPRRLLAVAAITAAIMVGSGGWRALDSGVAGSDSAGNTSSISTQSSGSSSSSAKVAKKRSNAEAPSANTLDQLTP